MLASARMTGLAGYRNHEIRQTSTGHIVTPTQTKTGPFSGTGKHLRMFGQCMVMVVVISNRGRCAQGNGIGHGVQRQGQDDAAHHINHRMLL